MRSGLSLSDLAKKLFTLEARRKQSCLLPQAYRFRFKTLFEGLCLLKSIALDHSMFPVVWGGSASCVLITDRCQGPCSDERQLSHKKRRRYNKG